MQRLHIPLSRNSATTRRHRRVVWLLGLVVICSGLLSSAFAAIWFSRDLTTVATPVDTILSLRLLSNRGTWDELERVFGTTPLISNRSITLDDLRTVIDGEFSVFFLSDGSHVVAIHVDKTHRPSSEWLDAVGIVQQEVKPGVLLLSDRLLPISNETSRRFHWPLRLFSRVIGTLRLWDGDTIYKGSVSVRADRVVIRTNIPGTWMENQVIPDGIIAKMSTPAWSDVSIAGLVESMDVFAKPLGGSGAGWLEQKTREFGASIELSGTEDDAMGFVLSLPSQAMSHDEGIALIRTLTALHMPTTRPWTLPDHSQAQEIIIDPSLVTIEEQTILGNPTVHATANNHEFYLTVAGDQTFISNTRSLVEQKLQTTSTEPKTAPWCTKGAIAVDLPAFSQLYESSAASWNRDPLSLISQTFSAIVISHSFFGKTNMTLCDL